MFTSTNDVELVILTFWSFSPAVTVLFKVLLNKLVKIQLHQNLQGKKKKSWKSKVEIMELVNRTDNISVPLLVNISFSRTLNVEAAEYKERIQSEMVSTLQLSFPIAITSIFLLTALDSHRTHLHFCPTTHLSASRPIRGGLRPHLLSGNQSVNNSLLAGKQKTCRAGRQM